MPDKVLIIDTETTGLDPADSDCIEVGAVLFDVNLRDSLGEVSVLVNRVIVNPAESINKIKPALTTAIARTTVDAGLDYLHQLVVEADAIVAHNVAFDRQWFKQEPLSTMQPFQELPWICSMDDIEWPGLKSRPSVQTLALAHGVPVWAAHRALTDCLYLAHVFRACENLKELLVAAQAPKFLYHAMVSYDDRELAKQAGFRWNEPHSPRAWSRRMTEDQAGRLGFAVRKVEEKA